jgi:hypothetical protein
MLSAARRLRNVRAAAACCSDRFAEVFFCLLEPADRRILHADAPHWQRCAEFPLLDWDNALDLGPDLSTQGLADTVLEADLRVSNGTLSPRQAVEFQRRVRAEIALDLAYDRATDRLCALTTRGCEGGNFSNLGLYLRLSSRYVVLPVFHTHPGLDNEVGRRKASLADYTLLRCLHDRLNGTGVDERIYFPDHSYTRYGIDDDGVPFDEPGDGNGRRSLPDLALPPLHPLPTG